MDGFRDESKPDGDARAANILTEMRIQDWEINSTCISPTAHLQPTTYEELLYAETKKLSNKTPIPEIRELLRIPNNGNDLNNQKWANISKFVDEMSNEYDFDDTSVANLTKISKILEESPAWNDCSPKLPVAAFLPFLLKRWQRNRRDRAMCGGRGRAT
ncbi:hypothetical protein TWF788_003236 [Orbilia oligospora]|uniref:Uncharacterized protein n=1 Tax=Orbilia oligospora TaxID=2813651 RepID=A0A7C8Q0B0_ORBOL|nr:hypothetical protein TWF788_003236 [Orbilia oligospora]